jgi:hypothetical protein
MAKHIFRTDEWTIVDLSQEATGRIVGLLAAVVISVALGLGLGSLFLTLGAKVAATAPSIAHESGSLHPRDMGSRFGARVRIPS